MAVNNRSTLGGAVAPPPSSTEYAPEGVFSDGLDTTTGNVGTSESNINPVGGGGTDPNDTPITLTAGIGLAGGGEFTTNQATAETITFDLMGGVVTPDTYGGTQTIQSITVDEYGRVTDITVGSGPTPVDPFDDRFVTDRFTANYLALETTTTQTVNFAVQDGYTFGTPQVSSTGSIPVTISNVTVGSDMRSGSFEVEYPAITATQADGGTFSVSLSVAVTQTSTGATRTETTTPVNRRLFIPVYSRVYSMQQTGLTLDGLDESSSGLTNGFMVSFTYDTSGPTRQYGYLALERVQNRVYRFDAGFFDISTDPTGQFDTRFGRVFDIYEFPTQANLSFNVRW